MFETTIAGSLPKPGWLAETGKLWPAWRQEGEALAQAKRDATLLWLKEQEDAGIDIVSDGEQSRQHFVHGFLERIEGIDWAKKTKMGIRDNRYVVDVPTVTGPVRRRGAVRRGRRVGARAGHRGRGGVLAINASNVGRAVPSLALIAFFVAYLGVGFTNLTLALVLLAIPPILTNTYVGVRQVDRDTARVQPVPRLPSTRRKSGDRRPRGSPRSAANGLSGRDGHSLMPTASRTLLGSSWPIGVCSRYSTDSFGGRAGRATGENLGCTHP